MKYYLLVIKMKIIRAYSVDTNDTMFVKEELQINYPKKMPKELSDIIIEINNNGEYIRPKYAKTVNENESCMECCLVNQKYDCSNLCCDLEEKIDFSEEHNFIIFENIQTYELLFKK